jgi:hypothetical protein
MAFSIGFPHYSFPAYPVDPDALVDLLDALWAACDASPDLEAAFGRAGWLWRDEAPAGAAMPFAVCMEVGRGEPELSLKDGDQREVPVQLSVYGTKAQAIALGGALESFLLPRIGYTKLAWTGEHEMTRWPGAGNMVEKDPDRGPDGQDVWVRRINVTFRVAKAY